MDAKRLSELRCRPVRIPLGPGPNGTELLRWFPPGPGSVCLQGAWAGGGSIITTEPLLRLDPDEDPIATLAVAPIVSSPDPEVVGGGWFGWLAYDGPSYLGFHDHVIRADDAGQWHFEALWSTERGPMLRKHLAAARTALQSWTADSEPAGSGTFETASGTFEVGRFTGADREQHLVAVERAVELIRAGEIYQVNVCTRLDADLEGSATAAFAIAAAALQPSYGAYVAAEDRALVSFSPELFLRRRGRRVTTAPIKGTWPADDPAGGGADALARSAKDAAENVMIVDLMRNDLGRVCVPGTVRAPVLLDVQKRSGVWHLISTVVGELRPAIDDATLLSAVFPPGSVTGAPKVRAVAAISELEAGPRGAYTGAVGFVSPCWGVELSVAIRTFELRGSRIELGLGGGVTADSVPMLEWQECLHKAAPLLGALGTGLAEEVSGASTGPTAAQRAGGLLETLLVNDRVPVRLPDHLARLDRSAREVYGTGLPTDLSDRVHLAVRSAGAGRWVLRIVLDPLGQAVVSVAAAACPPLMSVLRTAPARPGLARHKWAARDELLQLERTGNAPLFIGPDGAVLETSRGNVFLLRPDGGLVTPPLRDDLLPGITRRALLDLARDTGRTVELRSFDIEELRASPAFWTSSLSGCVPIAGVDDRVLPRRDSEISALASRVLASGKIRTR